MAPTNWTERDTAAALRIWADYRRKNDLAERAGQTVGIDPKSGKLWFGQSIPEVVAKRDADGVDSPLRFERVGADAYYLKGGRR